MSIKFYMDVHIRRAITVGLRLCEVDVLTAQEDGKARIPDPDLLERATELGRVLVTQDKDLLSEAAFCQQSGKHFAGIIYAHQLKITISQFIADLELIAKVGETGDFVNRVEYLPIK